MDILILKFYQGIIYFYHSSVFTVIKILLGIYSFILLADIIMLLIKKGIGGSFRQGMLGIDMPQDLIKKDSKTKRKYKEIRKRLKSGHESEYKIAILEADRIIDKMITKIKYAGNNLGEKLEGITPGQILCLSDLKSAHEIANEIVHDENFKVSRELAIEVLDKFEKLLTEFE